MTLLSNTKETNPLDQLRTLLGEAENRVGALERGSSADVLKLFHQLDQAEAIYSDLDAAGVDLRAEATRRETIQLTVQRKSGVVLRLLNKQGGIAALRVAEKPPLSNWWWRLDDYAALQRRATMRGLAVTAMVVLAILAVATVLYQTVFRPDPALIAHMNHVQNVQKALEAGDMNGALQAVDNGLAEFANDGELLLWRGAVLVRMKRAQEAESAFAAARQTYSDEVTYLLSRSQVRLQANDVNGSYADAQAAIALAPQSAYAYLMLGGAQELRGEVNAATQSYSTAASLAAANKDVQLEAMAKVRMAMMMQSAPMFPDSATPQPTPTR